MSKREEKEGEVREAFKKTLKFSEYIKKNVQLHFFFFFFNEFSDNPQLCTILWPEYLSIFPECLLSNVTSICQVQVIFFPIAQGFKIASAARV